MSVQGKTALVTGSTSGIGLGLRPCWRRRRARDPQRLRRCGSGEGAGRAAGRPAGYHGADLGDAAQIADMMDYAEREFGGVDILINNAGIQHGRRWISSRWRNGTPSSPSTCRRCSTPADWRCRGCASATGAHHQRGVGARAGGVERQVGLCGGQAWRGGLTKTLALETARTPVTCNAICPGWVLTPLVQQQIDKRIAAGTDPQRARDELLAEKQPSQAFVTPEQLGELALFLCSDAAAQVRGAAPNMDGGWLAQ